MFRSTSNTPKVLLTFHLKLMMSISMGCSSFLSQPKVSKVEVGGMLAVAPPSTSIWSIMTLLNSQYLVDYDAVEFALDVERLEVIRHVPRRLA